jgi:multicomponent Na+:H+ antiporter subunit G
MEWLIFSVLILGALFVLISAIGLLRLPDLYMRMHATTKTTSMGVTLILAGIIMAYPEVTIVIKGLLIIIFIYLTAPLGTHMISKAGHLLNIKKWDRYVEDDMEEAQGNG